MKRKIFTCPPENSCFTKGNLATPNSPYGVPLQQDNINQYLSVGRYYCLGPFSIIR